VSNRTTVLHRSCILSVGLLILLAGCGPTPAPDDSSGTASGSDTEPPPPRITLLVTAGDDFVMEGVVDAGQELLVADEKMEGAIGFRPTLAERQDGEEPLIEIRVFEVSDPLEVSKEAPVELLTLFTKIGDGNSITLDDDTPELQVTVVSVEEPPV